MKLLTLATLALSVDAAAKYKTCTESERMSIFGGLTNELTTCSASSTYDLTGKTLPTSDQRQTICKCTDLVKRMTDLRLPRCNLVLDGSTLSFKDAVTSIFTECGIPEPKEVPETPAPSTDGSIGSEATPTPSKTNATTTTKPPPKMASGSGSGLDIETIKPTATPKSTKKPTPTTARPDDSGSDATNATNATPAPTKDSSAAGAVASAAVALIAAVVSFAVL